MNIKLLYTKNNILFAKIKYREEVFSDYKPHYHNTLSFGVIEKGSLTVTYKKSQVVLKSDELVVFNQNQIHCTKNINACGYFMIHFEVDWCKSILNSLGMNINQSIIICKSIIKNKEILQICHDIYYEKSDNEKLIKIVTDIFIKYYHSNNINKNSNHADKMKEYIQNNINESISIHDISKELGYNQSYLNRIFKKHMGISPQKYIVNEKINIAEKELIHNTYSIADIAHNSGFYDQSHFNKNFKKIFGITPLQYKKSI